MEERDDVKRMRVLREKEPKTEEDRAEIRGILEAWQHETNETILVPKEPPGSGNA